MNKKIVLIGGAGFFGFNFRKNSKLVGFGTFVLDKMSYASHDGAFLSGEQLIKLDASNITLLHAELDKIKPDVIINFAAQSHVDNSIKDPRQCYYDNYEVVVNILEWMRNNKETKYIQISTDEVYGDRTMLGHRIPATEASNLNPSSPYSATKAAADLLINAYRRTYDLKKINIVRFTNLFGPYQHKEKMIPKYIDCVLTGKKYSLYGSGNQTREWTFIEHACRVLDTLVKEDINLETINITSDVAFDNLTLLAAVHSFIDKVTVDVPEFSNTYENVADRPGHDDSYMMKSEFAATDRFRYRYHQFMTDICNTLNVYVREHLNQKGKK